jgi:hypothetical protein
MLEMLFATAAARGLMTGVRVGPEAHGEYRLVIWVGPRVGERYEWHRHFPASAPLSASLGAIARDVFSYCEQHDWGGGWAAALVEPMSAEAAASRPGLALVTSAGSPA